MSSERLAILEEAYKAWNDGDFERWSRCWEEDVVYDVSAVFWDQPEIHGREEMSRFGRLVLRAWDSLSMDCLETIEVSDERIVQRVHLRATGSRTGLDVDRRLLQTFEYRGSERPVRGSLQLD